MVATIKTWLVLTLVGVAGVGAAGAVYGPRLAREMFPQIYIARAVLPIAQEIVPDMDAVDSLIAIGNKLSGSWRQEMILGVSSIDGVLADNINAMNPMILPAIPTLTLHADTRWDSARSAYSADLRLQLLVTTVFSADLFLDQELIALQSESLFGFPVTANPRTLGSEWNSSLPGSTFFPTTLDDELFYQAYRAALFFERREAPNFDPFIASLRDLAASMEFDYLGRDDYDIFSVTIPVDQANISARLFFNAVQLPFVPLQEDFTVLMHIDGSRLVLAKFPDIDSYIRPISNNALGFTLFGYSGEWHFDNNDRLQHSLTANGLTANLLWDHNAVSGDNFAIAVAYGGSHVNLSGSLRTSGDRTDAHLRTIEINVPDIRITLNLRSTIQPLDSPVTFASQDARRLTDLTIIHILDMTRRIGDTPIGGIIGNILP